MNFILLTSLSIITTLFGASASEKDACVYSKSNIKGECIDFHHCEFAEELIKQNRVPKNCGFGDDSNPIVCCPLKSKSEQACLKYYPPLKNVLFVSGGEKALELEFPHMALLGYGEGNDTSWSCGGTLISDQYILTAAHCLRSQDLGAVRWVLLGALDIQNVTTPLQNFSIIKAVGHPQYKGSSHYHDIALLQLDRKVNFNPWVKPACLNALPVIPDDETLQVTGWGKIDFTGPASSYLLKAQLFEVNNTECRKSYSKISKVKLANGIVGAMQICAGHPEGKDTCPGDSGGPLQYKGGYTPEFWRVAGVTSFGKACGFSSLSAGVYTRVSYYLPWIESIVWPS